MGIEVRYFRDELTFSSRHLILLFFNPLDSLRHLSLLAMEIPHRLGDPVRSSVGGGGKGISRAFFCRTELSVLHLAGGGSAALSRRLREELYTTSSLCRIPA